MEAYGGALGLEMDLLEGMPSAGSLLSTARAKYVAVSPAIRAWITAIVAVL